MGRADDLLTTIEAIHKAGLDPGRWSDALESMMNLTRSRAATLETFVIGTLEHRGFHGFNMRPGTRRDYLAWDGPPNPRAQYAMGLRPGDVFYDGCILDDDGIDRDPFYAEFLAHHDVRYFVGGVVDRDRGNHTVVTIQRTAKQGHATDDDIALMPILLPHVRLAMQVAERVGTEQRRAGSLGETLDWLFDGAVLLRRDGTVVHGNRAFFDLAAENDGLGVDRRGGLVFATSEARRRFGAALKRALALRGGESHAAPADVVIERASGAPPLRLSVRPLFRHEADLTPDDAVIALFVRDPLRCAAAPTGGLATVLGLTPAEADMAEALIAGESVSDYARRRGVSINTAYTHLRRLKDKTGAHRLSGLIRTLNDAGTGLVRTS